jgi:saccharopine dehydrogenase-like NADP-dependent oxidoreductase
MKKKVVICGGGRMGRAITWSMAKLNFDAQVLDVSKEALTDVQSLVPTARTSQVEGNEDIYKIIKEESPDVVISSLPYHQTQGVGMWCIENNIRYCDLGGRVDVSHNINEYAKKVATKPVMTDLGLAPGWVNILAEHGYHQIHAPVHTVEMMVGGIPLKRPSGPLKYLATWSIDGLLNEYRDDCEILVNGKIVTTPGLSHYTLEEPEWEGCVGLESFCTSGGAAHSIKSMQRRGVKNCMYKTLRWVGHHKLIDFLMNKCKLDDKTLRTLIDKSAAYETSTEDAVIIMASAKDSKGLSWKKERVIISDNNFTAMQKATAFPISSVAALLAHGELEGNKEQRQGHRDQFSPSLSYEDVPYNDFEKNLNKLFE